MVHLKLRTGEFVLGQRVRGTDFEVLHATHVAGAVPDAMSDALNAR